MRLRGRCFFSSQGLASGMPLETDRVQNVCTAMQCMSMHFLYCASNQQRQLQYQPEYPHLGLLHHVAKNPRSYTKSASNAPQWFFPSQFPSPPPLPLHLQARGGDSRGGFSVSCGALSSIGVVRPWSNLEIGLHLPREAFGRKLESS